MKLKQCFPFFSGAKVIVQVSKKKSEPLLSYAALGPVYVSPNTVVGEKESAKFFPDDYLDSIREEEEELKEKSKKKKRVRGSRSEISQVSIAPTATEDETTRIEEEMEGEMEEEGEGEELEGDDLYDIGIPEPMDEPGVAHEEVQEEDKATSPMEN